MKTMKVWVPVGSREELYCGVAVDV